MTFHISEFEKPAALEDKKLEELTGCPIHKAIDSVCTEPGCPNNGVLLELLRRIRLEDCLQEQECVQEASRPPETSPESGQAIYQTESRMRCIL